MTTPEGNSGAAPVRVPAARVARRRPGHGVLLRPESDLSQTVRVDSSARDRIMAMRMDDVERLRRLESEIERRLTERFAGLRDEFDRLRLESDRRWFGFLDRKSVV